ncbi:hypothetical protein lacNasYZ03_00330 [Lactobacillus nasalidis]|uniref:NADPH-dependent FMN reductase-like domain-containing protein n=1 Tax=Lactobacillus nasalidis TaxID=2797258 RepID=A0ABQ3W286_9LACO|nr:NAD(P)H-dependent oxidoreductase [Lactobacillus nasalidis]GHV98519.1 hypothetical protein lacNasYZ01_17010 [Lactobacillus nasalidis]GHW00014.1 hypothetical protein lacNasYZ02_14430 [Lactobacillus nasalidis]GHW00346.1 hypothetical protein lacNasYZ03_00330 [Lactobacillus nasalidis]
MNLFKKNTNLSDLDGKIVFINASENANGTTARMGRKLLQGKDYQEVDLSELKIYQLSQRFSDDQFDQVLQAIDKADTIVLGAPIYWHSISGYAKVFFERLSRDSGGILPGKKFGVFIHGSEPSDSIGPTENLLRWFTRVERLENLGVQVF